MTRKLLERRGSRPPPLIRYRMGEKEKNDVVGIQVRKRGWAYLEVEAAAGDRAEGFRCLEAVAQVVSHQGGR
jgi:hypothetical protein